MKLMILGNGFDLHHGYKTSFSNFRQYLKKSPNEGDLKLVSQVDEILDIGIEDEIEILWNNFESIIGDKLKSYNPKNQILNNYIKVIEEFNQRFHEYLISLSNINNKDLNPKLLNEFESASLILTFNFTSFHDRYINKKNNNEVFHIHGTLSNDNLPLIGYYYPKTSIDRSSSDYNIRFRQKVIHKPALAYKQNEIDFSIRLEVLVNRWAKKIKEIIIIGYSFGNSDEHIYQVLDRIMISQVNQDNVPYSRMKNIDLIKIAIYSYDDKESELIIKKIKNRLSQFGRKFSINITGKGFTPLIQEIITLELKYY